MSAVIEVPVATTCSAASSRVGHSGLNRNLREREREREAVG